MKADAPFQLTAAANAAKVAAVLQSDRFKEALSPLRRVHAPNAMQLALHGSRGIVCDKHIFILKSRCLKLVADCTITCAVNAHRLNIQSHLYAADLYRAECEPAAEGSGLKVVVVSKAFEGKSAKRREKLVLQV